MCKSFDRRPLRHWIMGTWSFLPYMETNFLSCTEDGSEPFIHGSAGMVWGQGKAVVRWIPGLCI